MLLPSAVSVVKVSEQPQREAELCKCARLRASKAKDQNVKELLVLYVFLNHIYVSWTIRKRDTCSPLM
jgi:hypothetical protein